MDILDMILKDKNINKRFKKILKERRSNDNSRIRKKV